MPIKVKYLGLIPMTKRGYLATLAMAAAVAGLVLLAVGLAGRLPPLSTLWEPNPDMARHGFAGWFYNYMWWLILICLLAQAVDTFVVLRCFARKEAQQRAQEIAQKEAQQRMQETALQEKKSAQIVEKKSGD